MPTPSKLALALVLAALAAAPAAAQIPHRNLPLQSHWNEFGAYSACWSYIHEDGREYAVLGTDAGTAIYNVTDLVNSYRVGFIPGAPSIWREMKSYRNWIYVVTEAAGVGPGLGMQIIRMTNPEIPVLAANYTATFVTAHTVAVDSARAILICNGTRNAAGSAAGMRILSLANPEAPVEIARWPVSSPGTQDYIHDCVPIGNRLYASSIYSGIQRVFDFTNPANPVQLASWNYPGAFTHNSWPDASGNLLYVTDEVNGEPLKIFDISTLSSPVLVNTITSNPLAIVHNAHVLEDTLYLANYTEGVRMLDISDPLHPAEFAWADSWPGASGGFHGVWEFCPYFPSGTVIASDIESGLYVYRPVRNYGLLRVRVLDAATGQPLAGATVRLIEQGDSHETPGDGVVQFGPSPGTHTVGASKFGYVNATTQRTVTAGSRDSVVLVLGVKPVADFVGTVTAIGSGAPLDDAEVRVNYQPSMGSPYSLEDRTDAQGNYLIGSVPDDNYQVEVRRPGFAPWSENRHIGPGTSEVNYSLRAARTWDPLESESGWTIGALGDDATGGVWTRVEPLGTGTAPGSGMARTGLRKSAAAASAGNPSKPGPGLFHKGHEAEGAFPGEVQPEVDRTPSGTMCFVTGQGTNPDDIGEADLDGGHTTLVTPPLDPTGLSVPTVGYWRWFYASNGTPDDRLEVSLSNDDGATWVIVETVTGVHNRWEERAIRITDYYATPGDRVRLRFVATDGDESSIVEAAIDDLVLYQPVLEVGVPGTAPRLAFRGPWPNPTTGTVRLGLALPAPADIEVIVLDLGGRAVRTLHDGVAAGTLELSWDGRDGNGREVAAGVYLVRACASGAEATSRVVRIR